MEHEKIERQKKQKKEESGDKRSKCWKNKYREENCRRVCRGEIRYRNKIEKEFEIK